MCLTRELLNLLKVTRHAYTILASVPLTAVVNSRPTLELGDALVSRRVCGSIRNFRSGSAHARIAKERRARQAAGAALSDSRRLTGAAGRDGDARGATPETL